MKTITDELLKNGYSSISLGYIGIYEMTKLMTGVSQTEEKGREFALKVMNILKDGKYIPKSDILATHPHLDKRIKFLKQMRRIRR